MFTASSRRALAIFIVPLLARRIERRDEAAEDCQPSDRRLSSEHLPEMSAPQANEAEKNIEIWKVKKLIKRLEAARGNGTSMISLIIRE